ncbi:hypothetical protein B0T24DRAFT_701223 [Lasiosphaeria ovina]|uniref:Rhodopsin domain-containing protein n=1 Tax=Lasiosphaeria ovina TaxID=92902 RepID=A0AAE0KIV5_9PEZI|nr:hypothetical protein B0T24DRAFT_701223 [Lasiosphaeria ovina]
MSGQGRDPALDRESRFGEIVAILTIGSVLSTVTLSLRCYARVFLLRCFGRDDGVMVAAQVLTIGSAIAIGFEAQLGLGRHTWTMPPENLIPYMKSFYSSIVVYNIAVCLTKISILLQYRRIFSNALMQRATQAELCFLCAWAVTLAFLLTLVCIPVAAFWDPRAGGRCLDGPTIWYTMAGVNLVTDFAIFTMPLPVLRSLHLPRRQKNMLIGVFCLGVFPCAVSIYRIRTLRIATQTADPLWDNVDAATWSFLELSVAVVAACLPTLRPILVAVLPRVFGASSLSSAPGSGGLRYYSANGGDGRAPRTGGTDPDGSGDELRGDGRGVAVLKHKDDIEFGALDRTDDDTDQDDAAAAAGRRSAYSVHVTAAGAGWGGPELDGLQGGGIKTTTVVTQKVTAGEK